MVTIIAIISTTSIILHAISFKQIANAVNQNSLGQNYSPDHVNLLEGSMVNIQNTTIDLTDKSTDARNPDIGDIRSP